MLVDNPIVPPPETKMRSERSSMCEGSQHCPMRHSVWLGKRARRTFDSITRQLKGQTMFFFVLWSVKEGVTRDFTEVLMLSRTVMQCHRHAVQRDAREKEKRKGLALMPRSTYRDDAMEYRKHYWETSRAYLYVAWRRGDCRYPEIRHAVVASSLTGLLEYQAFCPCLVGIARCSR